MDLAQRRAHRRSRRPRAGASRRSRCTPPCPVTASVPSSRNQSAPSARMPAHVGHRLDVVGERRRCDALTAGFGELEVGRGLGAVADLVDAVPPRRCDARERLPTVEHLEQSRSPRRTGSCSAPERRSARCRRAQPAARSFLDRAFEATRASTREVAFIATTTLPASTTCAAISAPSITR